MCKSCVPWSIISKLLLGSWVHFNIPEHFSILSGVKSHVLTDSLLIRKNGHLKRDFGFPNTHLTASAISFLMDLRVLPNSELKAPKSLTSVHKSLLPRIINNECNAARKASSPDLRFLYFHLFNILLLHLDFHPSIPHGPQSLKILSQCRTYSLDKVRFCHHFHMKTF